MRPGVGAPSASMVLLVLLPCGQPQSSHKVSTSEGPRAMFYQQCYCIGSPEPQIPKHEFRAHPSEGATHAGMAKISFLVSKQVGGPRMGLLKSSRGVKPP